MNDTGYANRNDAVSEKPMTKEKYFATATDPIVQRRLRWTQVVYWVNLALLTIAAISALVFLLVPNMTQATNETAGVSIAFGVLPSAMRLGI